MNKRQKGFTLIELLIVVAIILIIAAIASPHLMRSRMAANQASAVGSLRTISTAEVTYSSTYGVGFSPDLVSLGGPAIAPGVAATCANAGLIDTTLSSSATPMKSGYNFAYTGSNPFTGTTPPSCAAGVLNFTATGIPVNTSTGQNGYFIDDSGVIRFTTDGSLPTSASPALQ